MLEMIKFGTNINGHFVPAEIAGSMHQPVSTLTAKINYSLECIDKQMGNPVSRDQSCTDHPDMTQPSLADHLNNVEGLEGVELRQLGSFLKTSGEDGLLGNLYRMTTPKGHVKWVCRDHYRTSYQEAYTQKLRDTVRLAGGTFDEQLGKVDIVLKSSFAASEFYDSLCNVKGVLELIIDLKYDCTWKDIDALQDALKRSLVSILYVDLRQYQPSFGSQIFSISTRYTALYRLLEPVNLIGIHLVLPNDLLTLSNFTPKKPPHLRRLTFEMVIGSENTTDIRTVAEVLFTGSTWPTLYLRDNSIREKGAQALVEAIKASSTRITLDLSRYAIKEKGFQALLEALATNSTLTTLNLLDLSIGGEGFQTLLGALKTNSNLTALDWRRNAIGDKGVQALSKALAINSTWATLNLSRNAIGEKGSQALFEALKTNKTLTTLDLGHNAIGDEGTRVLSDALIVNSTLTTLNLETNLIGIVGARALSAALKINSTLTTLDMKSNRIEVGGVLALCDALKINSTLTTLKLGCSSTGLKGIQALSDALKVNSTLTTLDMKSTGIGKRGALALSDALKINSTLTTLILEANSVGVKGAQALSDALRINSTLTTLDLGSIGESETQVLS